MEVTDSEKTLAYSKIELNMTINVLQFIPRMEVTDSEKTLAYCNTELIAAVKVSQFRPRMEMTDSEKHSSLLQYRIYDDRKKF